MAGQSAHPDVRVDFENGSIVMKAPGERSPVIGSQEERWIVIGSFGIDFMYLAIYGEKRNTIIVLWAKAVFLAIKWLLTFNCLCANN